MEKIGKIGKIGLTPIYYIITILGYIAMTWVYAIFLQENLKHKHYGFVFGLVLIFSGYALLVYEYYVELNIAVNLEKQLHIDKKYETRLSLEQAEQKTFQSVELELVKKHFFKGHAVLFVFYALSFIAPINHHLKISDITAVFGHLLIYTNTYLTLGYMLMLLYYMLYFTRNYKEAREFFVNKLQVVGSGMLIYHYIQAILYMLTL